MQTSSKLVVKKDWFVIFSKNMHKYVQYYVYVERGSNETFNINVTIQGINCDFFWILLVF